VINLLLRELQAALNQKADAVQQSFVAVSEELHQVGRRLIEARGEGEGPILAEQEALRARQERLAAEVNVWRDQARAALRQYDEPALRGFLEEMLAVRDAAVQAAAEAALHTLDHPEEAPAGQPRIRPQTATPARRLLERARGEFDLRGADPEPRQRAAVEFANRPGMAQNDVALAELEAALEDDDPIIKEVALLAVIQLHRFRAMRLGDLDAADASVRWLARRRHRAVIPVLIEILSTPRTGYTARQGRMVESDNLTARLAVLESLVEWRTAAAQAAVRARQHDRDPAMAEAASLALEAFPGDWRS
jgi:hypothetical protein